MKKILLTIVGLATASPAWSSQTAVTEISGIQPSVGALKTQVNTKLGTVESNRQDHETRVAAVETGKAAVSCFANAAAANACSILNWLSIDASGFNGNLTTTDDTLQEIAQKVDDLVLGSGSGVDAFGDIVALWASGSCTGYLYSDGTCSTPPGTLPTGAEGQTIQYNSSGQAVAVNNAPLTFAGSNISYNSTTGLVTLPVTATATSGSVVPLTSGGAYTALAGKENADSTIVKVAEIDTQAEFESLVGWPLPSGGTGGYVSLSAAPYSDVACTTGTYGQYGSTAYLCTGGFWASKWTLTSHSNPTPGTYSLTITPSGFTGADKFTYSGTDYTTQQVITGLSADASFTVTPDTGRAITCAGTGLTDNMGGSYTANTDTANVVATCTSTAGGVPTQIVETAASGSETGVLSSYTVGQSFASQSYPLYSFSVYVASGSGTLTCRIGASQDLSSYSEQLSANVSSSGWIFFQSITTPTLPAGTGYIACSGSGIALTRSGDDPYASGVYKYSTAGTWNLTNDLVGKDLLLRVSVTK